MIRINVIRRHSIPTRVTAARASAIHTIENGRGSQGPFGEVPIRDTLADKAATAHTQVAIPLTIGMTHLEGFGTPSIVAILPVASGSGLMSAEAIHETTTATSTREKGTARKRGLSPRDSTAEGGIQTPRANRDRTKGEALKVGSVPTIASRKTSTNNSLDTHTSTPPTSK